MADEWEVAHYVANGGGKQKPEIVKTGTRKECEIHAAFEQRMNGGSYVARRIFPKLVEA